LFDDQPPKVKVDKKIKTRVDRDVNAEVRVAMQGGDDLTLVDHETCKDQVEEFIMITGDARMLSERSRDYYDGKQWTPDAVANLKKRKQSPIVNNRIKVKLNGLLGLVSIRKGDPKCYPRNVDSDSNSAEAATDGLRYAADKAVLNSTFLECADNFFCEGYCGVNTVIETTPRGDTEVTPDHIPWDRLFFDPYSRKHDFSDARYKGFAIWMDEDDIINTFPDANADALSDLEVMTDTTFNEKAAWSFKNGKRKRHLVVTHYLKVKGQWILCIYTGGGFLIEPMVSPYLDEYDAPTCPIEIEHIYIDREGNRYGEIASFLDLQDEINFRRSKALFLLSQRQTFGNRGAVQDIMKAKRELAKPDGHMEVNQGEFGKDFGILPTGDMAAGQFQLLQEAKQEMDGQSFGPQLQGQQQGEQSGIALQRLQQANITELIKGFENFSSFKLRVYRQMWNRIRQSWDSEKWIRVTDDEDKLRWVGFNVKITMKDFLQETMDDESLPREMRLGASAKMIQLENENPDGLAQLVETRNKPAELDLDIILDEQYDTINASQEQLDAILKLGAQQGMNIIDLLHISNIQGKEKMIEKLEARQAEAAKAQEAAGPDPQATYLDAKAKQAQSDADAKQKLTEAQIKETEANTQQTVVETQVLQNTPPNMIPIKGSMSA